MPERVYLELADGTRVRPRFDPRQVGEGRLSSVQYLKFAAPRQPVAVGVELDGMQARTELSEEQRAALAEDLAAP